MTSGATNVDRGRDSGTMWNGVSAVLPGVQSRARLRSTSVVTPESSETMRRAKARLKLKGAISAAVAATALERDMAFRHAMLGFQKTKEEDPRLRRFVLNPYRMPHGLHYRVVRTWELLEGLFTLFMLFFEPLCTLHDQNREDKPGWMVETQLTITIFFILDIFFNLNVAKKLADGTVVETRHQIFWYYWHTYLKIDLLATVAGLTAVYLASDADTERWAPFARILVIIRAFNSERLLRLPNLAVGMLSTNHPDVKFYMRWVNLGLFLTVSSYLLATLFVLTASLEYQFARTVGVETGVTSNCKLHQNDTAHEKEYGPYCMNSWMVDQAEVHLSSVTHQWLAAFYWALTTMTSVGYGDISATTVFERSFMIFALLVGAILFSLIVALMTQYVGESLEHAQIIQSKSKLMQAFFQHREVPRWLQMKITDYYLWRIEAKPPYINEKELMAELSPPLRRELFMHINSKILSVVPLLQHGSFAFRSAIVTRLQHVACLEKEYVIIYGEVCSAIYFILSGSVNIVDPYGKVLQQRGGGSFFGEKGLLRQYKKYASERGVKIIDEDDSADAPSSDPSKGATKGSLSKMPDPTVPHTVCTEVESVRVSSEIVELYSLNRKDFNELMFDFPEFERTLQFAVQIRDSDDTVLGASSPRAGDDTNDVGPERPQTPPINNYRGPDLNSWARIRRSHNRFQDYYKSMLQRSRTLQAAQYKPTPLNLNSIALPPRLNSIITHIARSHHEQWAHLRIRDGWKWGTQRDNVQKLHPQLVPWEELAPDSREYNMDSAETMFKVMQKLGFTVVPPHGLTEDNLAPELQQAWNWQFGTRSEDEIARGATFIPRPCVLHDGEPLPENLRALIEEVASTLHERWAYAQVSAGWKFGTVYSNEKKLHNGLIPYEFLLDNEKDRTRNGVTSFFNALRILQCHVVRKSDIDALPVKLHRAANSLTALRRMHRLSGAEGDEPTVEDVKELTSEGADVDSDQEVCAPDIEDARTRENYEGTPAFDRASIVQLVQQNAALIEQNKRIVENSERILALIKGMSANVQVQANPSRGASAALPPL